MWRTWGFSNDMIIAAAKESADSTRPIIYMNSILSNWKSSNIFSVEKIPPKQNNYRKTTTSTSVHFANERNYTDAELDKLYRAFEELEV